MKRGRQQKEMTHSNPSPPLERTAPRTAKQLTHAYMHVSTYTHIQIYAYTCTHKYTYIQIHVHAHTHTLFPFNLR